ncbi:MAG: permease DsdX, partial [Gemmatimonadaceae bacterium]
MTHDSQLLLFALLAVIALILLIARARLHPFIALVVVSLTMGIAAGMPGLAA